MLSPKKLLFSLFLVFSIATYAQSWQDTTALIDKLLNRFSDSLPLGQLAISRNGQISYSTAKGMANLEYRVPLTKTSKMEAGSVSKQFTAACILLLQQQGKLSLTDDIRKYLPEIPDYGTPITIQHMMHHTSGIKDWIFIAYLSGWLHWTRAYDNNDALHIIAKQKTLNNKPGEEYIYSNSNYVLLAIIVERVSGMSLQNFSNEHIFKPAGMLHTEWRRDYKDVVLNRATGYSKRDSLYITDMPNENAFGHAGLLTTAEDFLRWNNFYLSGKFGTPSLLSEQIETSSLNNGNGNVYAAGLRIDSINGWSCISHRGLTAGYRASLECFPQLGLSIAWLSNNSQSDLSNMQPGVFNIPTAVRNILVKDLSSSKLISDTTMDFTAFAPFMGAYFDKKSGFGFTLNMKEGKIYNKSNVLIPIKRNTLAMGQQQFIFTSTEPREVILVSGDGNTTQYRGTDSAVLNEITVKEYSGEYSSEEAESTAIILVRDNKPFIKLKPHIELPLLPVYKDGFSFRIENLSTASNYVIYFERDKKKIITSFIVSEPRAKGIRFVKNK